jgi:hypothetical protein
VLLLRAGAVVRVLRWGDTPVGPPAAPQRSEVAAGAVINACTYESRG